MITHEFKIKACPFCGEKEKVATVMENIVSDSKDVWQVLCLSCKASGPTSAEEPVAIARWNYVAQTRTEREKENEQK